MPSDPNEFFSQRGGGGNPLDAPLDKTINHADLIGSGYTPHEDIDKHIEEVHDWGSRYVTLSSPIEVLAVTAQGDVSATDIDLSSYTTPNTYAVYVKARFRDSASAGTETTGVLEKNGSGSQEVLIKGGHINNLRITENAIVQCDENQIIEYSISASGANTAAMWVYLLGYYEYIYKPFKE